MPAFAGNSGNEPGPPGETAGTMTNALFDTSANDEIAIYGKRKDREKVNIENDELQRGFVHEVSDVIARQPAIQQIPESGSSLLVRSGCVYDNRYLLAGIAMFPPFHFSGHPNCDIDASMVTSFSDIQVVVDRLGGRYGDVTGVLIEADPTIYRPASSCLVNRPELVVDYSNLSQDFSLSLPKSREGKDFYQLSVTRVEPIELLASTGINNNPLYWSTKFDFERKAIGYGPPKDYFDATFTGHSTVQNLLVDSYVWGAFDRYVESSMGQARTFPWGMGSVRLRPAKDTAFEIIGGGSCQRWFEGKRIQNTAFLKDVRRSNGVGTVCLNRILRKPFTLDAMATTEYLEWTGTITQRDTFFWPWNFRANGSEVAENIRISVSTSRGRLHAGVDAAGSGLLYGGGKGDAFFDAGVFLEWHSRLFGFDFYGGKTTSRPDIRGLPDPGYRSKHCSAYQSSLSLSWKVDTLCRILCKPYVKYQDHAPFLSVADIPFMRWIPSGGTALRGCGVSVGNEWHPLYWLSLENEINFNHAVRIRNGLPAAYEWDVPCTIKIGSRCSFMENRFSAFTRTYFSKGIPYYDHPTYRLLRAPDYVRTDISFNYRSSEVHHRHLTRYDLYMTIKNVTNRKNIRDYCWNQGVPVPIDLVPLSIEIGAKLAVRM